MKQFSSSTIRKWISDELYLDQDDSLIQEFVKLYSSKKEIPEAGEPTGAENPTLKV